ncbi:hypothetical protein K0M31_017866 [Melipona bicolor]|uniref:Uncharacterized protein n=1 Tax=Melipona bicolor TaxID=60889 RepID=A0AA40G649_9HYME|nr:hypothetical protein K0M31_017866 [Melipona bicolor]
MPVLLSLSSEANWTRTAGPASCCCSTTLRSDPPPLLYTDNVMGPIWNTKAGNSLIDLSQIVTDRQNKPALWPVEGGSEALEIALPYRDSALPPCVD